MMYVFLMMFLSVHLSAAGFFAGRIVAKARDGQERIAFLVKKVEVLEDKEVDAHMHRQRFAQNLSTVVDDLRQRGICLDKGFADLQEPSEDLLKLIPAYRERKYKEAEARAERGLDPGLDLSQEEQTRLKKHLEEVERRDAYCAVCDWLCDFEDPEPSIMAGDRFTDHSGDEVTKKPKDRSFKTAFFTSLRAWVS